MALLRLNNQGAEYDNPVIESAKPAVNISVRLSTANISIFQLNDNPYKPSLLRQTFSEESKLCTVESNNYTRHIPIFSSTFNQPNSSYHVVIEPLLGINEKTWMLSGMFKTGQHSDSITGLCTIFSAIDILAINTLTSNLFGLKILYFNSVVTYDLIPSLVLISGGLVILNKLILRSYYL
ncbi:hypothetical protein RhiirA1_540726 [Rhizophagus irregularis]|uniref:Uncharacterized protein n=1 Tax=Rhizophagus irregularis TaxID=588596 RepID=A0A2N0R6V0_9GLOM|nr:hypothetical protein RhiirA1_540726 [Rhizophagus irregularis]